MNGIMSEKRNVCLDIVGRNPCSACRVLFRFVSDSIKQGGYWFVENYLQQKVTILWYS